MKQCFIFQKLLTGTLILLLQSVFNITSAQTSQKEFKRNHSDTIPTFFTISYLGVGMLATNNHSGNLDVSFPYTTMDANGIKTEHTFNGTTNELFSKQSIELTIMTMDFGKPNYTLSFGVGINTKYGGSYWAFGYGRNIYLGKKEKSKIEKLKKSFWIFRPSLNVAYFNFKGGTLGNISNTNTTIFLLDQKVEPTYKYNYDSHTVNADNLSISYRQNQIGIEPKITFCTNPYKSFVSIQIFASCFLPIWESGGLSLKQSSNTDKQTNIVSNGITNSFNANPDITATYNNHTFHAVPFHANYIHIGIIFGLNVLSRPKS